MKSIKKASMKKFIHDILIYEDGVDPNTGKNVLRTSMNKEHYKPSLQIRENIADKMLFGVINKQNRGKWLQNQNLDEVKWVTRSDLINDKSLKDMTIVAEKHQDEGEVLLNESDIKALKYLYNTRKEPPIVDLETFEEFEKLID